LWYEKMVKYCSCFILLFLELWAAIPSYITDIA